MNSRIVAIVGPSGAGKTTLAKRRVEDNVNMVRVNRDDIRTMLHNCNDFSLDREINYRIIDTALADGYDVIIDNTNVKARDRDAIRELAAKYDTQIEWVYMLPSLPLILHRRIIRHGIVPRETCIQQHYDTFSALIDLHKELGIDFNPDERSYIFTEYAGNTKPIRLEA